MCIRVVEPSRGLDDRLRPGRSPRHVAFSCLPTSEFVGRHLAAGCVGWLERARSALDGPGAGEGGYVDCLQIRTPELVQPNQTVTYDQ